MAPESIVEESGTVDFTPPESQPPEVPRKPRPYRSDLNACQDDEATVWVADAADA